MFTFVMVWELEIYTLILPKQCLPLWWCGNYTHSCCQASVYLCGGVRTISINVAKAVFTFVTVWELYLLRLPKQWRRPPLFITFTCLRHGWAHSYALTSRFQYAYRPHTTDKTLSPVSPPDQQTESSADQTRPADRIQRWPDQTSRQNTALTRPDQCHVHLG